MNRISRSAYRLAVLVSGSPLLLLACGSSGTGLATADAPGATAEVAGDIRLELAAADGTVILRASYLITGAAGFSRSGTIELASAPRISALIPGLPAGNGYRIALSATSAEGATACMGTAEFAVTPGITTPVTVPVQCHEPERNGSAAVQGRLNVCPVADGVSAAPTSAFLGASVSLAAIAHDPDSGPSPLSYRWTATAGTFAGGSGATPTFTCTQPGTVTITVRVSDGDENCGDAATVGIDCKADSSVTYYTTKTPYRPKQDESTYEPPPAGFSTVFTEMVARHGSRGLSSVKYDAAAYNMWKKASEDGALTELGASLGADILRIMKANALLGFGVAGITSPGYGNLTQLGINEHRALAARLLHRQSAYFASLAASAESSAPRAIQVLTSGVDRAVDSAAFFAQSLTSDNRQLASLVTYPPAPTGYPANAPIVQPAGANRFLLYFHKLAPKTDLVSNSSDPYYQTYQDSLAFQAYANAPDLNTKLTTILADPGVTSAARAALDRLFGKAFVDRLENKTYAFANTGTYTFASEDGLYSTTVAGDGKTSVKSVADAASMLYNLYVIAPALVNEVNVDFSRYLAPPQARTLAYLQDAQDFYQMGPGIQEANPITYQLAQALEDDFFKEIDAIARGDLAHGARLRFTHAEIIIPFASLLGLSGIFAPVPSASTYSYETNPWRGELVAPMAANIQWDVYRNSAGALLVKMFYDEKETDFKVACENARYAPGSHYYNYEKLAACYGHPR